MRLIVLPEDGVTAIVMGIRSAKRSIDMPIFRLDHVEIDKAIKAAVKRGVIVRTLIAHVNSHGEKSLRKLEDRLLATGATVSRTAADLVRYHNKIMIVDRRTVFVLGFNYTHLDIDRSRSFGIIIRNRRLVNEATKLFEADFNRLPYTPSLKSFVVSPENSRARLAALLKSARSQLMIYDMKASDRGMLKILQERAKAGVEIKVLGKIQKNDSSILAEKFPGKLHVRAIIQDRRKAFIGSQGLRKLELEGRREVGVIVSSKRVVQKLVSTFESDWAATDSGEKEERKQRKRARKKKR
jgi:phosphatidylserine/phosphatidylglycerophosphate/cardiolipin synthase-like enzyme